MCGADDMPESRRYDFTWLCSGRQFAGRGRWRPLVNLAHSPDFSLPFLAVTPQAQTLTDALAETYNTNPQLLAQRALLRETDEQVPQALSFWRPTVTFTGQVGFNRGAANRSPGARLC